MSFRKTKPLHRAAALAAFAACSSLEQAAAADVAFGGTPAALRSAKSSAEKTQHVRVTFMDGKLAVNVPSHLRRESGRMLVYANEQGSVILSAQPGPTKQTPLDFLNEFEAEYKNDDANAVVLRKGEISVGNHVLQRIDLLTENEDAGKFYVSHVFGMSSDRVFSIAVMADANDADAWAKAAEDIIQSLSDT